MHIVIKLLYIFLIIIATISLYLMNIDGMSNIANLFFTLSIVIMIIIKYLKDKYEGL